MAMTFHSTALSFAGEATAGSALAPTVASVAARAAQRDPLRIAFLGGSLTWGANSSDPNRTSYRGRMMQWLREKYPNTPFTFHDAAIGGTGSDLALFRIERDVIDYKPDLVFLDFTVNDDIAGSDVHRLATYERVLRNLRASGTAVMPVLMSLHAQIAAPSDKPLPARYVAHRQLAEAYGLVFADTLVTARAVVASGRVTANELYPFGNDKTHPDDNGYELFFEAARDAWLRGALETEKTASIPQKLMHPDLYPRYTRSLLADVAGKPLPDGWRSAKTYRTSMWFDGLSSRWMGNVACASASAGTLAPLEVTFRGSFVGLFGEINPLTPPFRIWIDGQPVAQPGNKASDPYLWNISTARFGSPASGAANLFTWTVLAKGIADGEHSLKIVPDFSNAQPGAELRIESVCSAGL